VYDQDFNATPVLQRIVPQYELDRIRAMEIDSDRASGGRLPEGGNPLDPRRGQVELGAPNLWRHRGGGLAPLDGGTEKRAAGHQLESEDPDHRSGGDGVPVSDRRRATGPPLAQPPHETPLRGGSTGPDLALDGRHEERRRLFVIDAPQNFGEAQKPAVFVAHLGVGGDRVAEGRVLLVGGDAVELGVDQFEDFRMDAHRSIPLASSRSRSARLALNSLDLTVFSGTPTMWAISSTSSLRNAEE
jgi:hypothetical protein